MRQTVKPFQIIVVDDGSTDRTAEIALSYPGVQVVHPRTGTGGSKARAQNSALPFATGDLVLPVDADTVLADNYIELIVVPFANPDVVVAAGCVLTKVTKTPTERGRSIEYLFGFTFYRPIQNMSHSPVVCSGCCSAFRRSTLVDFGGFPERTIVEDMDYTWSQQCLGNRAVYVGAAVAYAADPETYGYLKKQVWRWMSGFFQNVRIHRTNLVHKPMLALWVGLSVWEIFTAPLWWSAPVVWPMIFHMSYESMFMWWIGIELAMTIPVLMIGAARRKLKPLRVLASLPFVYGNKVFNCYYAWKALVVELILVPLGWAEGLHEYVMGR
jgi:cellulose synthase/poly-beta-1,6-N-acetylglucosamine synthase-like glycosyltransferase